MQIKPYAERVALWRYTYPILATIGGLVASGVGAFLVQQWTNIRAFDIIVISFGFFVVLPVGFTYAYRLEVENRRNRARWTTIRSGLDESIERDAALWKELDRHRDHIEALTRKHVHIRLFPEAVYEMIAVLTEIERLIPSFEDAEARVLLHEYVLFQYGRLESRKTTPRRRRPN